MLSILLSTGLSLDHDRSVVVTATVYQAVESQCDSSPLVTAFGYKIDPKDPGKHRYIAISRDLESVFSPGDSVYVEGTYPYNDTCKIPVYDGIWIIADRMNARFTDKVDLLIGNNSFIDLFTGVTVTKINTDAETNYFGKYTEGIKETSP